MAFWSSQTLEANLKQLVLPHDPELVDCNAITLRVGREIYITPGLEHPSPNSHTKQLLDPGAAFAIPPGQFAFILTEEVVTIPPTAMGFISIKAKYKSKGLVNVSGFHVDPGWSGPLVFAVFNAGPASVHLQRGLPLFLLWIADLDEPSKKRKATPGPECIEPLLINNITGAVNSLDALDKRMREELKKLSDKDTALSDRMHALEKKQFRVLVGLGLAAALFMSATGFVLRNTITSVFTPPAATRSGVTAPADLAPAQSTTTSSVPVKQ
jgi:dCTP deaminase